MATIFIGWGGKNTTMPDYWKKKDFWGRISLRDMIIMSKSISFIFSHKIDLNTEAVEFSFDLPKKNEC